MTVRRRRRRHRVRSNEKNGRWRHAAAAYDAHLERQIQAMEKQRTSLEATAEAYQEALAALNQQMLLAMRAVPSPVLEKLQGCQSLPN